MLSPTAKGMQDEGKSPAAILRRDDLFYTYSYLVKREDIAKHDLSSTHLEVLFCQSHPLAQKGFARLYLLSLKTTADQFGTVKSVMVCKPKPKL